MSSQSKVVKQELNLIPMIAGIIPVVTLLVMAIPSLFS